MTIKKDTKMLVNQLPMSQPRFLYVLIKKDTSSNIVCREQFGIPNTLINGDFLRK